MRNFRTILLIALALFAIMLAGKSHADEAPVTAEQKCTQWCKPFWKSLPKEEYVYFAAASLDMLTTLDIKHHPELHETNFILGEHPSDAKVIGWFILTDALHAGITYELVDNDVPKPIIKAWEYISIGVETGYAVHNYKLGLRFSF
jgi:hypothetical protein